MFFFLRNADVCRWHQSSVWKMSYFVLLLSQSELPESASAGRQITSRCQWDLRSRWPPLIDALISTALIVHEGPSVFRIFHRWQAVNQQWKVLNYDKSLDSKDLKNGAVDRSLSQPSRGYHAGIGVSASTSSLMVVASTAAGSTSTSVAVTADGLGAHVEQNSSSSTVPEHHCPYNILHILSHLRQPEARSQPSNSTRELVMRVTTVWGVNRGLTSHAGGGFDPAAGGGEGKTLLSVSFKTHLWGPYMNWIKVKVWFAEAVGEKWFQYLKHLGGCSVLVLGRSKVSKLLRNCVTADVSVEKNSKTGGKIKSAGARSDPGVCVWLATVKNITVTVHDTVALPLAL